MFQSRVRQGLISLPLLAGSFGLAGCEPSPVNIERTLGSGVSVDATLRGVKDSGGQIAVTGLDLTIYEPGTYRVELFQPGGERSILEKTIEANDVRLPFQHLFEANEFPANFIANGAELVIGRSTSSAGLNLAITRF